MKNIIVIPETLACSMRKHLFQNEKEQGAFLFAQAQEREGVTLHVQDVYLVPTRAWDVQMDVYLEMKDSERAKIMKAARDKNLCAIDCHSHPKSGSEVWFSASDVSGISEFAQYAKWKLDGKPFAAMVWGNGSVDAVIWCGDFAEAKAVDEVQIAKEPPDILTPTQSWFRAPSGKHGFKSYD